MGLQDNLTIHPPSLTSLTGEQWAIIGVLTLGIMALIMVLAVDRKKKKKKQAAIDQMSEIEEGKLDQEIVRRSRSYLRDCRRSGRRNRQRS